MSRLNPPPFSRRQPSAQHLKTGRTRDCNSSDGRSAIALTSTFAPPCDGRARSLVACAAVRREGAVARGLRRRLTGGRGRSWPAPRGRSLGVRNLFTMRLWLHFLVALLPGYHCNHIISVPSFLVFTIRARLWMGHRLQDQRAMEHQSILQECTLESFRLNSTLRRRRPLHRPRRRRPLHRPRLAQ